MQNKASTDEIRKRFDIDVDRFSNLETGQVSSVDSALSLELITESAKRLVPDAKELLDIGCGGGNYTLKMLSKIPELNCTLVDLSLPMLERAQERITTATTGSITVMQSDIREAELEENKYDIILAGAVLHHLRDDNDWQAVFSKLYRILKKGGCLMIFDLIAQEKEVLNQYFEEKYIDYLTGIGGMDYARKVLNYIEKEDTPRPLSYQLQLMKESGFSQTDILHKNICFAAYCGIK